ncbi:DUF1565 domain-containing protein, partial [Leptospira interrogans]
NPNPDIPDDYSVRGISIQNFVSIKIKNNTITGMPLGIGIQYEYYHVTAVGHNIISGNQLTFNYHGIINNGIRASYDKVENNVISKNYIGIGSPIGLDLGQGPTGSAGNNTISCNSYNDIWIPGNGNETQIIYAMNNNWDHFPPQISFDHSKAGLDIGHVSNATLVYYEDGGLAPNACK